jgi:hypothetical protein
MANDADKLPALYYLDTSAVRCLGNKIDELPARRPTFVSALVMMELLSGIMKSQEEYRRRRAAIRRCLAAGVKIAPHFPDTLLHMTFDYAPVTELRTEALQKLLELAVATTTQEEFRLQLPTAEDPSFPFEYFETWDDGFGQQLVSTFADDNIALRRVFEEVQADKKVTAMPIQGMTWVQFCDYFSSEQELLNKSITIRSLAQTYAPDYFAAPTKADVEAIYESYNGKADSFVAAFSRAVFECRRNMSQPGRNDALDLAHFLYLAPPIELISNDNKMLRLAGRLGITATKATDV